MKQRKYLLNNGVIALYYADFHKDIPVNHSKNRGGGKWYRDEENNIIYLYDVSAEFGVPDEMEIMIATLPRGMEEYSISFQPECEFLYELKTPNNEMLKERRIYELV